MDLRTLAKVGRYALDDDYRKEQNDSMKRGCLDGILTFTVMPLAIWGIIKYYKFMHSLPIVEMIVEKVTPDNILSALIILLVGIVIPTGILIILIGIVIAIIAAIAEYFEK